MTSQTEDIFGTTVLVKLNNCYSNKSNITNLQDYLFKHLKLKSVWKKSLNIDTKVEA